jgi:NitT/TauT family transport system ATP-binding protein
MDSRLEIELAEVTKEFSYGGNGASSGVAHVGPITMEVKRGEFVALVGHSGCGKTTLLNLIGGLVTPTTGVIRINGKSIVGPQTTCGFVFQEFSLFPWRTAIQNVEFGLELRGATRSHSRMRAEEYLDLVKLRHVLNAYPGALSGGMKQRVAIARALAYEPSILLMDEPFGSLDAQTRDEMQEDLLKIWAATSKTIVFVTHSIREAVYLASRVVLMKSPQNKITKVFDVPLPYPRGLEAKVSPEMNAIVYAIHGELRRS